MRPARRGRAQHPQAFGPGCGGAWAMMTVLARKQGAALVIRDNALGIFTDKGFTPVDFKVELAMKLASRLKYTPVLPAQEMEERDLLQFLAASGRT